MTIDELSNSIKSICPFLKYIHHMCEQTRWCFAKEHDCFVIYDRSKDLVYVAPSIGITKKNIYIIKDAHGKRISYIRFMKKAVLSENSQIIQYLINLNLEYKKLNLSQKIEQINKDFI